MPLAEAGRRGNCALDRVHELAGSLERLLLAPAHDRPRDLLRVALLAVAAEDRDQLALRGLVDQVARRELGGRVHAHVERRVHGIGEAALGPVELHARDAEVEQDRVGAEAVPGELLEDDGGLASKQARGHTGSAPEALEVRPHTRVAVDRDEAALPLEVGREQGRVAAGAEGRVDDGLPRLHREQAPHLVGKNGDVISRVWLQGVRQHAPHSLPLPAGARARRRGSRSRGGRRRRRRRPHGRGPPPP